MVSLHILHLFTRDIAITFILFTGGIFLIRLLFSEVAMDRWCLVACQCTRDHNFVLVDFLYLVLVDFQDLVLLVFVSSSSSS